MNAGMIAGREPVARMMRSKLRNSSPPADLETRSVFEFSKSGASLNVFDLVLFRKHAQAAGQFFDHAFFPGAQMGEIDLGIGVFDAPCFGVTRLIDQLGHMQQGLGGNTSAVQTDSARIRFRIDQRNLQSQIGSQKCRGITARSATHYCDMQICLSHLTERR